MRVAIFGASGYTGLELMRIVLRHPELELAVVTSEQRAGEAVGEAFPGMRGLVDLAFENAKPDKIAPRVDVAFTALPHATAAPIVAGLRKADVRVVDISADFRLDSLEVYEEWYGPHGAPELFGQAVYGLPEWNREQLAGARLVAAPGCYPTAGLLPLLPFLRDGRVEPRVVVDAKSGVSGAGRSLNEDFLFGELDENAYAYKVAAHRHGPEMEQVASGVAGTPVSVTFVPHLIPAVRGMLASVYMTPTAELTAAEARRLLEEAYADAPFVRVLPEGEVPRLAHVRGTNFCDVGVVVDPRHGTVIGLSAIDNLVKGAVGQGVQCLNLCEGWDERLGLMEAPLLP